MHIYWHLKYQSDENLIRKKKLSTWEAYPVHIMNNKLPSKDFIIAAKCIKTLAKGCSRNTTIRYSTNCYLGLPILHHASSIRC